MLKLIRKAEIFSPLPLGIKDVLIAGDRIVAIRNHIEPAGDLNVEIIEAKGLFLVPGFIDSHVHIVGGGGEGGYTTRTPEIRLTDITRAGVTTVVGCLGTDCVTRSMRNLLAKAGALNEEGITAYCYTGSYQVPVRTLTGSIQDDLVFIEKVIGVGEIAVSDHRSSQPTLEELTRLASEARVGGMLSGKAGIVNIHVGAGGDKLSLLEKIVSSTEIPITQFLPTHLNRNARLLESAFDYVEKGGIIDVTAMPETRDATEEFISCGKALRLFLEVGLPMDRITFSSDGQGSLPVFDERGNFLRLGVGKVTSLFEEIRNAILEENIPLETALKVVTATPAGVFGFHNKGHIREGYHADMVLLDDDFRIHTVMARGRTMIQDKTILVKGTFEE